jgi:hypothetical protein
MSEICSRSPPLENTGWVDHQAVVPNPKPEIGEMDFVLHNTQTCCHGPQKRKLNTAKRAWTNMATCFWAGQKLRLQLWTTRHNGTVVLDSQVRLHSHEIERFVLSEFTQGFVGFVFDPHITQNHHREVLAMFIDASLLDTSRMERISSKAPPPCSRSLHRQPSPKSPPGPLTSAGAETCTGTPNITPSV